MATYDVTERTQDTYTWEQERLLNYFDITYYQMANGVITEEEMTVFGENNHDAIRIFNTTMKAIKPTAQITIKNCVLSLNTF